MSSVKKFTSRRQKIIGLKGIIFLVILANMVAPLSNDFYLPAMPEMLKLFNTTETLMNMTLVLFFLFFGIGTLFFGPLSDKYGRKPILVSGSLIYALTSFGCALSTNIYALIAFRIVQAFFAGACIAAPMAIVKDCFYGKLRDKILAIMQTVTVLAPIVAPILGAMLLRFFTWSALFVALGVFAILLFVVSILYSETLKESNRLQENTFKTLGRLFVVCKNMKFTKLLTIYSLLAMPFMGFIACGSYIYINIFGLSKQGFSYCFALTSFLSILGPILYIRLLNKVSAKRFSEIAFACMLICSILLILFGSYSYILFFIIFLPIMLCFSSTRPLCASVLFRQQDKDSGSVASLISALTTMSGFVGMFFVSIPFLSLIQRLGVLALLSSLCAILMWILMLKKYDYIPAIK